MSVIIYKKQNLNYEIMENVVENNESIALFVDFEKTKGADLYISPEGYEWERFLDIENYILPIQFLFHSSWEWLMPVVEKIGDLILVGKDGEPISYRVTMYDRICKIEYSSITYGWTLLFERHGNTLLEATYNTAVKFIEWYNENEMKVYEFKK